jgi:hypothetical protein
MVGFSYISALEFLSELQSSAGGSVLHTAFQTTLSKFGHKLAPCESGFPLLSRLAKLHGF